MKHPELCNHFSPRWYWKNSLWYWRYQK